MVSQNHSISHLPNHIGVELTAGQMALTLVVEQWSSMAKVGCL